ncbi:MAG: hypothetical protein A2W93_08220 [Bacteroidetes bacterium GWF2_43_63]|nr:MAG: hypothetical protein A2W94_04875 [Bacteroidetes bacterium GWE2_42_42]OFY55597.1 MAG: hypothetical protein A2W93_08220 [Bacteroidetes bacterium GWF2_43_63]HBG71613.1 DUF3098 domain-containing protein [Bacteroidales bacterium]HCB62146.1 DUF3098 domain-containing protein [Bacteroidales bacterium]HCY22374.1 DUF3098 domain-containing protein [Bacteroidales bacterium]
MSKQQSVVPEKKQTFVFDKMNYILMLIGLGVILLGFILMIGGGSEDPNLFSEDLYSFRRITLSPILILSGFVIEILAIMHRPKTKEKTEE